MIFNKHKLNAGYMLSYQHHYHAGNHADVLKHTALCLILESLTQKDTGFFYLDTHAARGFYDLTHPHTQNHGEFRSGILPLWESTSPPNEMQPYLNTIKHCNPDGRLRYYPGSPRLVQDWLRPQDRMVLCELHPTEYTSLKANFSNNPQIHAHHRDGYESIKAFLPPKEKRGLVLIDPAFEKNDEFDRFIHGVCLSNQRFPTGITMGWLPLMKKTISAQIHRLLKQRLNTKVLAATLRTEQPRDNFFYGSEIIIINPPWQLDEKLSALLPWITKTLPQKGSHEIGWIIKEETH